MGALTFGGFTLGAVFIESAGVAAYSDNSSLLAHVQLDRHVVRGMGGIIN